MMRERHIGEDIVRHVIAEPDHTLERNDNCTEYVALVQDRFTDRRIEVVVDEGRSPWRVVPVYELDEEWQ